MNETIEIPVSYIEYLLSGKCPYDIDYAAPGQWDNGCLLTKYDNFGAFFDSLSKHEQSLYTNDNSRGTCAMCWYRFLKGVEHEI